MKKIGLVLLLMSVFFSAVTFSQSIEKAEEKVRKAFLKTIQTDKNVHNGFLLVHSDSFNIHWDYFNDKIISPNMAQGVDYHYYHTASIGKTFVTIVISILYEQGQIDFNDPITKYLPDSITNGLNTYGGINHSNEIQIKHLLNHTSGIPDYFSGIEIEGMSFPEYLVANPDKFWTPMETIELAKKYGKSEFAPGKGYKYCDTEYNLLGLIIEEITEMELHEVYEKYIFAPLKINHTSLWLRSEPKIKSKHPLTKVYFGKDEVSGNTSISCDWAGGGIVSTSDNLFVFMKSLMENKLIKPETFKLMQEWQKESKGIYYGYGLMQFRLKELFFTLPDISMIGHSGSIGSFMYYVPEKDIYLVGSFGQSKYEKKHIMFLIKSLNIILKHMEK